MAVAYETPIGQLYHPGIDGRVELRAAPLMLKLLHRKVVSAKDIEIARLNQCEDGGQVVACRRAHGKVRRQENR
jgi:hypothetical protein